MQLNKDLIKNKQRILIGGNRGTKEIFHIVKTVLNHIGKPADLLDLSDTPQITDAPIAIMIGGDEMGNGKAVFHQLDIHMLLVHEISDEIPDGYADFDSYLNQYEQLADNLPKAGSLIYNESDNVALLLGKKERDDVKNIEYNPLKPGEIENDDSDFLGHAAAARALLKRIGVSEEQFLAGLKKL